MKKQLITFLALILVVGLWSITSFADGRKLKVKEISVFKDGHVFVLHEGNLPTDKDGDVLIDYLPSPILGTFGAYSTDTNVKLVGVTAARKKVSIERTALNLEGLIAGNVGAEVLVTEKPLSTNNPVSSYSATILGIPTRSSEELASTSLPNTLEQLSQKSDLVLLKTVNGTKILPISQIQDITFKNNFNSKLPEEEFRNQLRLNLDWGKQKTANSAQVGVVYVQKGISWIPSYKINLDGNGNATLSLQATLVNDLVDLDDVAVSFIVGVPSFAFKNLTDPIALQQTISQVSPNNQYAFSNQIALSNNISIQSQASRAVESSSSETVAPNLEQTEDLYTYKLKNVSLKRGERKVITLSEQAFKYKDVYTLDIPFTPPAEILKNINSRQQLEIAKALKEAKVIHKIRFTNNTNQPFTTAPAMITSNGAVIAQGTLTYTSVGASTDVEMTKAINVLIKKMDNETKRTPNAVRWQGDDYARIDLASSIKLTNLYKQSIYLEVTRYVLGSIDTNSNNGEVTNINVLEDNSFLGVDSDSNDSYVYNWLNLFRFNSVGKLAWKTTLEPGKEIKFDYSWHYFAR